MRTPSKQKILLSYLTTSLLITTVSISIGAIGVFDPGFGNPSSWNSMEIVILLKLSVVLTANFFLHLFYYFGGFKAAPLTKGLGIGAGLGLAIFLISFFGLHTMEMDSTVTDSFFVSLAARLVEYTAGGIATAALSVSDLSRWSFTRAF